MSESGWLQLAAIAGGLITMWISLHFKLKGVEKAAKEIKDQNVSQEIKIADVGHIAKETDEKVTTMKTEIDGRLTEYRRLVEAKAIIDVAAALVEGERIGIAKQKMTGQEMGRLADRAATVAVEKGIIEAEKKKNGD